MNKRKTWSGLVAAALILTAALSGCSSSNSNSSDPESPASSGEPQKMTGTISLVSREEGSGTRGAFIELFGIEQKDADGNKVDYTSELSETTNSTSVMLSTVQGNKQAIGYVSLGSLNSDVKALKIDGAEATVDNIKSGTYKVSRPFNIVTKDGLNETAADFVAYILSEDGQKIVENQKYISNGNTGAYAGSKPAGTIKISGSSSVFPLMEKLVEGYKAINPNADITLQQHDSTTGVTDAIEGNSDIGMASRDLKDSETAQGVTGTVIATDGIAVIVNKTNSVDGLTTEQVKNIFVGDITKWDDVA
jgi:phosphate transport system substrate-binding protein